MPADRSIRRAATIPASGGPLAPKVGGGIELQEPVNPPARGPGVGVEAKQEGVGIGKDLQERPDDGPGFAKSPSWNNGAIGRRRRPGRGGASEWPGKLFHGVGLPAPSGRMKQVGDDDVS